MTNPIDIPALISDIRSKLGGDNGWWYDDVLKEAADALERISEDVQDRNDIIKSLDDDIKDLKTERDALRAKCERYEKVLKHEAINVLAAKVKECGK